LSDRQRVIFHVDLDAFYVSAEVRENPALKGHPVVVGADPEGGKGRGVVVACSYEARKFGLRSGMPISIAYRMCPQAVYLRPSWGLYEKTSEEVMATLRGFADKFEQSSIDEAFLDVSARVSGSASAKKLAFDLKAAVKDKHGLTCSVGIAPNKSSAKIASDRNKPDGMTFVPNDGVEAFVSQLPVKVIPGVGAKTQEFLKEKGIESVGQLQKVDGKQLLTWFGKNGVWLWGVVHGQENIEVKEQELPKSLSVERTFREDVSDFAEVRKEAADASSELFRRLKTAHLAYRVGGIKIRFKGFETHTREKTLTTHSESEELLQGTVSSLLGEFEGRGQPVRLVGIRVADLKPATSETSSLDAWSES
jgi:DNA polymerase IV (archaeal DinB-like DNA polymerase)